MLDDQGSQKMGVFITLPNKGLIMSVFRYHLKDDFSSYFHDIVEKNTSSFLYNVLMYRFDATMGKKIELSTS